MKVKQIRKNSKKIILQLLYKYKCINFNKETKKNIIKDLNLKFKKLILPQLYINKKKVLKIKNQIIKIFIFEVNLFNRSIELIFKSQLYDKLLNIIKGLFKNNSYSEYKMANDFKNWLKSYNPVLTSFEVSYNINTINDKLRNHHKKNKKFKINKKINFYKLLKKKFSLYLDIYDDLDKKLIFSIIILANKKLKLLKYKINKSIINIKFKSYTE